MILLLTPVIAALLSLIPKKTAIIEVIAWAAAIIEFISAIILASFVVGGVPYAVGNFFAVDAPGALYILIIATIGFAANIYAIGYARAEVKKQIIGFHRVRQLFVLLHLFLAAMFFAVTAANPIATWIAIEATTLSTAFLISFYNKPTSLEAAWKYLLINSVGLLLGFFGILLFLAALNITGEAVSWQSMLSASATAQPLILKIGFIFILIGFGTKVGFVPMHTWLPDAHSKAPTPISSLLSGVLLSIALLAILRFRAVADRALGSEFGANLFLGFGVVSLTVSAVIMVAQKNYKRLLAYSSIEHMGLAALGFGFGGVGVFAALLHIVYHALAKSLLFFAAGNVFLKFSSTKIAKVSGALSVIPTTAVLLGIGLMAITGTPPFGLFLTEVTILSAGINNHPVIVSVALGALALVFISFLRHLTRIIFGAAPADIKPGEGGKLTLVAPLFLVILLFVLSVYIPLPLRTLIQMAAATLQ